MSKHKLVKPRRVPAVPLLLSSAVVGSALAVAAPYAGSAVSGSPADSASSLGPVAASGSTLTDRALRSSRSGEADRTAGTTAGAAGAPAAFTGGATIDPRTPQRVLQGFKLEAKPPPWVLPVVGYHLTARFGMSSGLWAHGHTGLDFAAPDGTQIRAIAPGTVTSAGYDGAYGNKTEIRLDDGTVLWFCHQSGTEVRVGQRVSPGQLIGYVGSTGNVTGPHLHLEVHPGGGGPVDPEPWLHEHGLRP
jgi:murein DD-endopeptidase MepM/ murein hydrolase activator NlpD